jgi:uncharacterized membrane protein
MQPNSSGADVAQSVRRFQRIDSIDLLRGIVMVVMMLDHTRDFVHSATPQFSPEDLSRTNVALFFTRWITHFCAPTFVFLAGTSAYLQMARGKSKQELSRFLITRGLWLIVLEFTLVRFGFTFNFNYGFFGVMQVIWVIGLSMILLAGLIYLPTVVVGAFGVLMIALHNKLDVYRVEGWRGPDSPVPTIRAKVWMILHQQFEAFPILWFFPSPVVVVIYPLIPWVGVMAAGFAFGAIYKLGSEQRRWLLLIMGGVSSVLFIGLRFINGYGDPSPWLTQKSHLFTVLSFINTTKYPPSLLYLLMTLGPALVALAVFEKSSPERGGLSRFFITFGRVPLFFYLLQWPTAHLISVVLHFGFGKPVAWLFQNLGPGVPPPGVGFNLVVVYLCWFAGIAILYPLCNWFAGVKARRHDWWLSYL